jgi:hypothetical protein
MRYSEIHRRPAAPDSHPFVADIAMPPPAFPGFERLMRDRRDVRLLWRADRPDTVVVHAACASEAARERLRDA